MHDARLRELLKLSLRGKISQRDLRIPLRVALFFLTKPFRRPSPAAALVAQRA